MIASVILIKSFGMLVAGFFLRRGWQEITDTRHHHVSTSHAVSPVVLLAWRVLMFLFTAGVLFLQVHERGPRAFRFFTVWNWTAIILYFFLASVASAMAVRQGGGGPRGSRRWVLIALPRQNALAGSLACSHAQRTVLCAMCYVLRLALCLFARSSRLQSKADGRNAQGDAPITSLLSKTVATMFHVLTPMTLYIDIITWTVLVPALMKTPDLERRKHWERVMFSNISYAQHGLNALIMGVEMLINNVPNSDNWSHGVVCMWNILFALWALLFFAATGQAIYPVRL